MSLLRRTFLLGAGGFLCAAGMRLGENGQAFAKSGGMDIFTAINTRRSVRAYKHESISEEDIRRILEAGMMAPSAANEQPWEFIVIRKPELLARAAEINQYAHYAAHAPAAVLLCMNEDRVKIKGMEILDMGMCAENMMLAAHALGIGSVFTGVYPMKDRMEAFAKLANLPPSVVPVGLIVLGRPAIEGLRDAPDRIRNESIHMDVWQGK